MSPTTCIVLQTHKLNDKIQKEFNRIHTECKDQFDIILLYDNSNADFSPKKLNSGLSYHLFDVNDIATRFNFTRLGKDNISVVPGNALFPFLDFANNSTYRHYWRIEYDVRFIGNWKKFFHYFEHESDADLLGTTLHRYTDRPNWFWWASFKTPRFTYIRKRNRIRGFFPVVRLSQDGIKTYTALNKKEWRGHFEVVLPTALYHAGLKIEDIGGSGSFVKEHNINRFYTNNPMKDRLDPGTFVCPPSVPIKAQLPNKLYHAIK